MEVNYFNETSEDITIYENLLNKVFKDMKESKSIQIVFVDNSYIQDINRTYRQINKATDVISFPNDEPLDDSLGDIFISIEQAKMQALNYEHSLEREIAFLAVHGYLHLMGYDHDTPEKELQMFELQESILEKANLFRK